MKLQKISALGAGLLLLLTGCADDNSSQKKVKDVWAMDTYMNLTAYGNKAEDALAKAEEKINKLDALLSVTSETSDIWRINNSEGQPVEVADDTAEIIRTAIEYGDKTGTLDVTIYPVLKEWGFTTHDYKIPDDDTLDSLLKNVDYSAIQLNGNTVTIPEYYMIDMGSLAKGYTSDKVIEELRKNGVKSAIVSLGGNVQSLGIKPDGLQWTVAIKNPFSPAENMCILSIGEKAVITSGNYERFFTGKDGNNYWHIIDKADGYPADNGLVSVTIIGDSGIMCDALSTSLFIAGTEQAQEYWRNNGGFDMVLVTDDGRLLYTDGIADSFKNVSSMTAEVISID